MKQQTSLAFFPALPLLTLLASVFFLNFLSRIALAPLLPVVEADLGLNHGQSGALFLIAALGNAIGLVLSGFISSRLGHRRTIVFSSLGLGLMVVFTSLAEDPAWFRTALFGLGVTAGTYLPSGIASITTLVRREDWGKAVAVHEAAPNGSYVLAPLFAEAVLAWTGWRQALLVLGAAQVVIAVAFLLLGNTTRDKGSPPSPRVVRGLTRRGMFWLLALFFALGVGGSFMPYSMLPLYLVDLGWARPEVNQLLAASRVGAFFLPFLSGWLGDRIGVKPMIVAVFGLNALALAGLGLASGTTLAVLVVIQPMFAVMFFPPGFAALSNLFGPEERSTAVSLIIPMAVFTGIGAMPLFVGVLGDRGLFHLGFLIIAGAVLAGVFLVGLLRVDKAE